jgi:hypothetical protein
MSWGFSNLPSCHQTFCVDLGAESVQQKIQLELPLRKAKVAGIVQRVPSARNAELFKTAAQMKLAAGKLQRLALERY